MGELELLTKIAGDVGALKQQGETQTKQIGELFKAVNEIREKQAEKKGEEKGKADVVGRIMAAAGIISSAVAVYLANGGKTPHIGP